MKSGEKSRKSRGFRPSQKDMAITQHGGHSSDGNFPCRMIARRKTWTRSWKTCGRMGESAAEGAGDQRVMGNRPGKCRAARVGHNTPGLAFAGLFARRAWFFGVLGGVGGFHDPAKISAVDSRSLAVPADHPALELGAH